MIKSYKTANTEITESCKTLSKSRSDGISRIGNYSTCLEQF